MTTLQHLANHLNQLFFGGNWTASTFKDQIEAVDFPTAIKKIDGFNSIATLVFHCDYYIAAVLPVFQGKSLDAKDEYSFDCPQLASDTDWELLKQKIYADAKMLIDLLQTLPDSKLSEDFAGEKHGDYSRNMLGIIEHTYYHLGQIALLKKLHKQRPQF